MALCRKGMEACSEGMELFSTVNQSLSPAGWWWVRRGSIDNAGGAELVARIGKQPHAGDTGAPLGTKGHRQTSEVPAVLPLMPKSRF